MKWGKYTSSAVCSSKLWSACRALILAPSLFAKIWNHSENNERRNAQVMLQTCLYVDGFLVHIGDNNYQMLEYYNLGKL